MDDPDPNDAAFEQTVPASGAVAFRMATGQRCRIIDLEGMQVPDLLCFRSDDPVDKLSVENTQLLNGTIFITTGHHLYSTRCTQMMTIVVDTCGRHDLISGSCSEHSNELRYGVRGTPNCRSNFERVLQPHGIPLAIPYSFNIFMNVTVSPEGATRIESRGRSPATPSTCGPAPTSSSPSPTAPRRATRATAGTRHRSE